MARKPHSSGKKLNIKLLVVLLVVPILILLAALIGGFILHGGDNIERLTRRNDPAYYIEKGDSLMKAGNYAMAKKQYRQASVLDTGGTKAILKLVAALEKESPEDQEEAARTSSQIIGLLYRVTTLDTDNVDAQKKLLNLIYEGAKSLGQVEMIDQLLDMSEKFYKNHPDRTFALRYRALARVELMKKRELSDLDRMNAYDDLKRALEIFPGDKEVISGLSMWNALEASRLSTEKGRENDANRYQAISEDILLKSLAKNPDDLELKVQLAQTLFAHEKKDKCLALLKEMETRLLAKPDAKVAPRLARLLVGVDTEPSVTAAGGVTTAGFIRADALLAVALKTFPENLEILYAAATAKKKLGQQKEALALLKKAAESKEGEATGVSGMLGRRLKFAATIDLANMYLIMAEKSKDKAERGKMIDSTQVVIQKLGRELSNSALINLLQGKIALLRGETALAIQQFEKADKKFGGKNPEAVFLSAVALQREGEIGAAIQRLERLSQSNLNGRIKVQTNRELAKLYLRAGDLTSAREKIDTALSLSTEDKASLMIKSDILDQQRKRQKMGQAAPVAGSSFAASVKLLKPVVDAGDVRARVQLAKLYSENNQIDKAVSVLEDGLETDPNNLLLLQQLVRVDVMAGEKDRAVKRLDAAIKAMPDNRLLPLLRQQVLGGKKTIDMLETMLKKLDDPFQSALGLYALYNNNDRKEDAAAELAKAAKLKPDNEKVLEARFGEAISRKDWVTAQKICDHVADLDLDEARGAFWQGRLELAQGQYVRAASSFQKGVKIRPLFSSGWLMLGNSHRLAGNWVEAENAYQEAFRLKPDNVNAIYSLFLVHDARGMKKMAMADLERARKLAPNNRRVASAYLAYLGKVNPQKALAARLKIAKENPDDWQNRLGTAKLLGKTGENQQALDILNALYQEHPDNLQVVLALAEYYRQAGDVSKGRGVLEDYVHGKKDAATLTDFLVLARFLMACGLSEPAVAVYEDAMQKEDPVKHEAARELGDWYFNNQFFNKALPLYERAFADAKDDPRLILRFVETLIYNNQAKRAATLLDHYVLDQGKNAQTSLLQCITAIQNKQFDRAATFAGDAVNLGPTNPQAYLYRARLNYLRAGKTGNKRQVIRDLEKSLSLNSTLLAAREMLVDCYLTAQPPQVDEAINQLKQLVTQKPKEKQTRIRLITLLMMNKRWADAGQQIDAAIEALPKIPDWYSLKASVLQRQDKAGEALPSLKKAFELGNTSQNLALLANGYVLARQPVEAVKLLDSYAAQVVKNPMLMAVKGRAQAMTGNTDMARSSFEMAFTQAVQNPVMLKQLLGVSSQLMPAPELVKILDKISSEDKTGMARMYAGELLLRNGKTTDGIARLEDVRSHRAKSDPNMPRLLHTLAAAYQKAEKYPEAARVYEELTTVAPKDFVAFNNLAFLLCEYLDKTKDAVKMANTALSLSPDDDKQKSNILDTLGWAQFKNGDVDEARTNLADSVRYDPGLYNQYHLARVLVEKGLNREARSQLRNLRRTAQNLKNAEFEKKANKLLDELK